MSNIEASDIRVQDLDHCGLIAGICDELGLVPKLDLILGTHPMEIVTPGQAVKAMILNGLGFVSAPLYLLEKFFVGKAERTSVRRRHQTRTLKRSQVGACPGQNVCFWTHRTLRDGGTVGGTMLWCRPASVCT